MTSVAAFSSANVFVLLSCSFAPRIGVTSGMPIASATDADSAAKVISAAVVAKDSAASASITISAAFAANRHNGVFAWVRLASLRMRVALRMATMHMFTAIGTPMMTARSGISWKMTVRH